MGYSVLLVPDSYPRLVIPQNHGTLKARVAGHSMTVWNTPDNCGISDGQIPHVHIQFLVSSVFFRDLPFFLGRNWAPFIRMPTTLPSAASWSG